MKDCAFDDPGPQARPFFGSWSLIAYTIEEGKRAAPGPFGERPGGLLSYTPDGAMSVHLFVSDNLQDEAREAAGYNAYFGAFRVDAERRIIAHRVHGASQPALWGRVLERTYRFEDDRLILTAWIGKVLHRLTWKSCASL